MIVLTFDVNQQMLTRIDSNILASNSRQVHQCVFEFSEEWDGMSKIATFKKHNLTYSVILDNDTCNIPNEVLKGSKYDEFDVAVYGTNGERTITTTMVTIPVVKGANSDGMATAITPNMFEQIMGRIAQIEHGEVSPETVAEAIDNYMALHPVDTFDEEQCEAVVADYVETHNAELKGDKGDDGITPTISVNATVSNTTGTPAVIVTKTGTTENPNIDFAFTGLKGQKGDKGDRGKSAYQIAVDNGYSGTEQEWLASLKGEKGDKGADGTSYDDTEIKSEINDIWKANGENNLAVEAYNFGGTWRNSQHWSDAQETFNGYTVKRRNAAWNGLSKQVCVESGKIYTFSAWIKAENASDIRVYTREPSEDTGITNILGGSGYSVPYSNKIPNNTWYKVMATFECSTSGTIHPSVVNANSGNTYVSRYELVEGIPQGGIYHVEKDGSGDYTSFVDCINDACQYMGSVVYVGAGVYDLLSELGETYVNSASSSMMGVVLKNRVHVICDANAILEMKYEGALTNVKEWLSAINIGIFGCTLENAHIETDNVRYSLHDDQGASKYPYINKFINCTFIHKNGMYENVIGGGIGKDGCIEIKGCYLEGNQGASSLVYYHGNNKNGETNAKGRLTICGNYFANGTFSMLNYGDSQEVSTAYVYDNSFEKDTYIGNGSYAPHVNTNIIQWNNVIRTSHIYEEYLPTTANGTVKKYSAAIGATTATFNASGFMAKYGLSSTDLVFDVSAETANGVVVPYNAITVNSNGVVTVTFDALSEATTFICKCSTI